MRVVVLPASVSIAGCVGMRTYGDKHPVGTTLPTACASVTSFAEELRSAPRLHGPDAYVGYFDYGPGMWRGHVLLVAPVVFDPDQPVGELLRSAAPRKQGFWLEAQLRNGRLAEGDTFEAWVPAKQHKPDPMVTVVEREAVLVRGSIHAACGKHYLVAVQGNPLYGEEGDWLGIRKDYDRFVASLAWPPST